VFRASRLRHGLERAGLSFLGRPLASAAAAASGQPRGLAAAAWPRGAARELARRWGGVIPPWLGAWQLFDVHRDRLLSTGNRAVRPIAQPPAGFAALVREDAAALDPLDAEIALELETRLPSWILVISDRSSMAKGVEVRVPFLDERVVEYALAIPPSMKMRGFREKAILREAARDWLPAAVIERRKQPFMTPIAPWFFGPGRPAFVDQMLSKESLESAGLFDPETVALLRTELNQARAHTADRFRREMILMLILGSQLLWSQFVNRAR
jgi:asparagine synthase (glutamine-hydrolysing)